MVNQRKSVEHLFEQALALRASERSAFLDEACSSSPELRENVERLLEEDAQAGSFLNSPLFGRPKTAGPLDEVTAETWPHGPDYSQSVENVPDGCFSENDILAGRFKIVRFIAAGGMGEVYEVEDRQLQGVRLALKTILPHIAANPHMQERFEREVLLARRVVHPNLCPIYDIFHCRHQDTDLMFLTMKLLPGETLAARIKREGAIPLDEAARIVSQVAAALAAAHDAGILHRDIKTANIMLAGAGEQVHAWVTDFGLARAYQGETTVLTAEGVAGTPGYVAPELFLGVPPSKASDVYAFGVVIYKMVTGFSPPVRLDPKTKVTRDPFTQQLPAAWKRLIEFCLEPSVEKRCQSFPEVVGSLHAGDRGKRVAPSVATNISRRRLIGFGAAGILCIMALLFSLWFVPAVGERVRGLVFSSSEKHIAVLPLDSIGGTPETQALGDGLMDSLAGSLSNLEAAHQSLWVVPANDVRARKVNDPASALREFGATIVVKGSFEHSDLVTRLKLTLIDPKKDRQIGFVDVETQTGDLAALQDEAVARLARLMNVSAAGEPTRGSGAPASHAAYEDYLAGVGYLQRQDKPGNLDRAISALGSAVKTDPRFALGFARLAQVYIMKYRLTSDPQSLQEAQEYSRRAAEMDDQVPLTYVVLAHIHTLTGNHDLAIQEFQRALSLDPKNADALNELAVSYQNEGRFAEAEAAYIKAAALRPDDWMGYNALGIFYENNGHPQQAIPEFLHALELTPDNAWPYTNLALAYQDLDDPRMLGKAETALKKSIAISPTFAAYGDLGFLYEQEHRFPESVAASRQALLLNDQSPDVWENLTSAYEWLKEDEQANLARGKAIELLEREIKVNPQDAEARATLAALYAKNGKKDRAIDDIHISLALSPKSKYVLSQVADSYELMGDRKQSIKYLEAALAQGFSKGLLNADPEIQGLISDPKFQMSSN